MNEYSKIIGAWVHLLPWSGNDYLAEYVVSGSEDSPVVTARDTSDGESFVVSEVQWSNGKLSFKTFMPSTKREGLNVFTLNGDNELNSVFTITVTERLQRKCT